VVAGHNECCVPQLELTSVETHVPVTWSPWTGAALASRTHVFSRGFAEGRFQFNPAMVGGLVVACIATGACSGPSIDERRLATHVSMVSASLEYTGDVCGDDQPTALLRVRTAVDGSGDRRAGGLVFHVVGTGECDIACGANPLPCVGGWMEARGREVEPGVWETSVEWPTSGPVRFAAWFENDGYRVWDNNRGWDYEVVPQGDPGTGASCALPGLAARRLWPEVSFRAPVGGLATPARDGRPGALYVVEKPGSIVRMELTPDAEPTLFADLGDRVMQDGFEEGLLSLAFAPGFPTTPVAFATYNADSDRGILWRLSRFDVDVSGEVPRMLADTEEVLIELDQPGPTHNGGQLHFGSDGMLYVSTGDGACCNDPFETAQDGKSLLGKLLRLDVLGAAAESGYAVPTDNPFVNDPATRDEIYALGFRNPWRWSFDRETQDLWVGDVGQNRFDEVDRVVAGGNYGWPHREASECNAAAPPCEPAAGVSYEDPVFDIAMNGRPSAVIGGYVYRGSQIPALAGTYVFSNFVDGSLTGLRPVDGTATEYERVSLAERTGLSPSAFAELPDGELVLFDLQAAGGAYALVEDGCRELSQPEDDASVYRFLRADGIGDADSARAYYRALLGDRADDYTFAAWRADYVAEAPVVSALYRNPRELSGWRETFCTNTVAPGFGGCWVRSWDRLEDRGVPGAERPVVAISLAVDGVAQFFAFTPTGELTPLIEFDSEGAKAVPEVCTACHGGQPVPGQRDLGALLRELPVDALEPAPGSGTDGWAALNRAVAAGNQRATSARFGFATARSRLLEFLARLGDDPGPDRVPASWATGATVEETAARADLWTRLVEPYCMPCHRVNSRDLSDYGRFEGLAARTQTGASRIESLLGLDGAAADALVMPQSETGLRAAVADPLAMAALEEWLVVVDPLRQRQCEVVFRSDGPAWTRVGQDVYAVGDWPQLGSWNPADALALAPSPFPRWSGSATFPCGSSLTFKLVVVDSTGELDPVWEPVADNRQVELPERGSVVVDMTWGELPEPVDIPESL